MGSIICLVFVAFIFLLFVNRKWNSILPERTTKHSLGPWSLPISQRETRNNMSALRSFRATDLFTFNNVYAQPALDSSQALIIHLAEIWTCGQKLSVFIVSS